MDTKPNQHPNKVVCPECGKVRMETPPGTTALPTLGMALKASGAAGPCGCGKTRAEVVGGTDRHEAPPQDA